MSPSRNHHIEVNSVTTNDSSTTTTNDERYSEGYIAILYVAAMQDRGWAFAPDGSDDPAAHLPEDAGPLTEARPFGLVLTNNEGTEWITACSTVAEALQCAHDAIAQNPPSKYAEWPVVILDAEAGAWYPVEARITVEALGADTDSVYPSPEVAA